MFAKSFWLWSLAGLLSADAAASPAPKASPSPAPANQNCAGALPVYCGTTITGDNRLTSWDGTNDCNVTHDGGQQWYYVDVAAGRLTVSTCHGVTQASGYDTKLSIFSGSMCDGLTCYGGSDDDVTCQTSTLSSTYTDSVSAGRYYIMVHGYNGTLNTYGLAVTCTSAPSKSRSRSPRSGSRSSSPAVTASPVSPPRVNERCTGALPLQCNSYTTGSMGYTYDQTASCGVEHATPQVWYYVDVITGQLLVSMCNADTLWDTRLSIFTGTGNCLTNLTCVDGNDEGLDPAGACGLQSYLDLVVPAGRYYIMVHANNLDMGPFGLSLTCTSPYSPSRSRSPYTVSRSASPVSRSRSVSQIPSPSRNGSPTISPSRLPSPSPPQANVKCPGAVAARCGSTVTGDTSFGTVDATGTDCVVAHSTSQVWFYVDVGPGQLLATTCNSAMAWDSQLTIYSGANCNSLSCVSGNDDGLTGTCGIRSELNLTVAGGRYYIMVHGAYGETGAFGLDLVCTPAPSPVSASRSPSPKAMQPPAGGSASRSRSPTSPKSASPSLKVSPAAASKSPSAKSPKSPSPPAKSPSQANSRSPVNTASRSASPRSPKSASRSPSRKPSTALAAALFSNRRENEMDLAAPAEATSSIPLYCGAVVLLVAAFAVGVVLGQRRTSAPADCIPLTI